MRGTHDPRSRAPRCLRIRVARRAPPGRPGVRQIVDDERDTCFREPPHQCAMFAGGGDGAAAGDAAAVNGDANAGADDGRAHQGEL